jgi:hypothetical protein
MKKILVLVIALVLLPSLCFGSVGLKRYTSSLGTATDIDIGDAGYFDGSTLSLGYTSIAGVSTMVSGSLAVPVTVKTVTKVIGVGGNPAGTLADGTVGQILVITASNAGTSSWTLTPSTKCGFTTITFSSDGGYAVLQFINSSLGWIVIKSYNVTIA